MLIALVHQQRTHDPFRVGSQKRRHSEAHMKRIAWIAGLSLILAVPIALAAPPPGITTGPPVAAAVSLTTPLPAHAENTSGLLASGSVWEEVGPPGIDGDWHVQFRLFSEGSGKTGHVKVQVEGRTGPAAMRARFDTSVCSGSFGTTAYAVGRLTSGELPQPRFPSDLVGFWAHDAGKRGTDMAWVVPITDEEHAVAVCADPQSVEPMFTVVGGNVVFKG
jgi:hypothetical protein